MVFNLRTILSSSPCYQSNNDMNIPMIDESAIHLVVQADFWRTSNEAWILKIYFIRHPNRGLHPPIMATKVREPKYQTIIHLPGLPGSFTFRKKGKLRLDQQVRNFCLFHQCKGCFEVKVHFPNAINPKKIKYDATSEGITVDTLADHPRHHYKLKVPYPDGLKLHIPPDPEAQFHFGKLSCKLAILKYDKNKVIAFHTKRRWKDRAPEKSLKEQVHGLNLNPFP